MFQAGIKGMSERSELIPCIIYTIILILHLSVRRESGRSWEAIRPELKHFFLFITGLGRYMRQSTDTAGNGTSHRLM